MDIESLELGGVALIVIVGLSIFLWGAINHENQLIEKSDNLEKNMFKSL